MNLYEVSYKRFGETNTYAIIAATPTKALEGAKILLKRAYCSSVEILSVGKRQSIDRVER
jgi:hypothetical protein